MLERVNNILSKDIEKIISSELSLELLQVYSILFLSGGQPKTCSNSQRKYYQELSISGIKLAKKMDKKRTCKPKWKGLRYISKEHSHFNSETIDDETAIKLLKRKSLSKDDFIKLPEDYEKKPKKKEEPKKAE